MKRSAQIRLLLLGGLAAGALPGCAPRGGDREARDEPRITAESFYTNDHYIEGVGYYHAPFRAFFPYRFNNYDAGRRQYFYGGQWGERPFESVVNISSPTPEAAARAEAARPAAVTRGGFGSTGRSHFIHS